MHEPDESLKRMMRDERSPELSPDFADRVWSRVQPSAPEQSWQWLPAGSLGAALGRRGRGTPWPLLGAGIVVLALASWGTHLMVQSHADEELNRLDAVGMSSLLTL